MGVKDLWVLLNPACCHQQLSGLSGQVIAVDLSIWIVEVQSIKRLMGVITKPHLRNLFFRISHLTRLGVKLVFAVEGDPPPLKWEMIQKRLQARTGGGGRNQRAPKALTRPHFKAILRECCELLDLLGVPHVQSSGEAEAMCAQLNKEKVVDAVITNDGDAFLYGARKVYRNFTMNTKDPHVESYCMDEIEDKLSLDRKTLVALALLLGCDYAPQGVAGVGKETVLKLIAELNGTSLLDKMQSWSMGDSAMLGSQISPIEVAVRRKAMATPGFPNQEVIKEFLVNRDHLPSSALQWKRPVVFRLQRYLADKLEWEMDYAFEKALPLVSLHDLRSISEIGADISHGCLRPHSIVKSRVKKGIPSLEIKWHKISTDPKDVEFYVTIEDESLFNACFPSMVEEFVESRTKKSGRRKDKSKVSTKRDAISPVIYDKFEKLHLEEPTTRPCKTNKVENQIAADPSGACWFAHSPRGVSGFIPVNTNSSFVCISDDDEDEDFIKPPLNSNPLLDDSDLPDFSELKSKPKKGKRHAKKGLKLLEQLRKTQLKSNDEEFSSQSSRDVPPSLNQDDLLDKNLSFADQNSVGNFKIETSLISNLSSLSCSDFSFDTCTSPFVEHEANPIMTSITHTPESSAETDLVTQPESDEDDDDSFLFTQSQIPLAERLKLKSSDSTSEIAFTPLTS